VVVYDLCLDSPHPATISIQVSDIHSVEVAVANKVFKLLWPRTLIYANLLSTCGLHRIVGKGLGAHGRYS
jgi:hypothetical protein